MRLRQITYLFLCVTLAFTSSLAIANDYRDKNKAAQVAGDFYEDRVGRLALSLGRSTGAIPADRAKEIFDILESGKGKIPADLQNTWQKLVRIAQTQVSIEQNRYFFSTGYEYETLKPGHSAWKQFKEGAPEFYNLLEGSFGKKSDRTYTEVGHFYDEQVRRWRLVLEWVRYNESYKGGYELVTPPLYTPEQLRDAQSFTWRLGQSEFGRSNRMTGAHQTFALVPAEKMEELAKNPELANKVLGRVIANMQLMQAKYGPAIFEILEVKRDGAHLNPFLRPIVFDHKEYLDWLKKQDPNKITLEMIYKKMRLDPKMIEKEFEVQLKSAEKLTDLTPEEVAEYKRFTLEQKAKFKQSWKYRDQQFKFNVAEPHKTLMEIRIGDWVSNQPEMHAMNTYVQQKMLNRAWELAEQGKVVNYSVPARKIGEKEAEYWARIRLDPNASKEAFLKEIGVTNPDEANMLLGRAFKSAPPKFKALEKVSYGFEIEGWTDDVVEMIVPNDPELRKNWKYLAKRERIKAMNKLGFDFEKEYSTEQLRILSTEFRVDTDRFPFMSPELHVEASGNWEVRSHGRHMYSKEELRASINKIAKLIDKEEGFGLHIHMFVPDKVLSKYVLKNADKATDLMERMTLHAALAGYSETSPDNAYHALDSYSLDRFSEPDLKAVRSHLAGGKKVKGLEQKYHSVAFRPVKGGIDWEFRDLGDDIGQGMMYVDAMEESIVRGNFGTKGLEKDKALFFDFRAYKDRNKVKQYTLEDALGKTRKLSQVELDLLRKFQFEVYKPSMGDYMFFINPNARVDGYEAANQIPSKYMDTKWVRTNFENNLAIPLLNWDDQSFLTKEQKALLAKERRFFLERVDSILKDVAKDPKYAFLKKHDNFLHLAEYLERSEHPTRPNFNLVTKEEAKVQRELLEKLTKRLRGEVVRFVNRTKVEEMVLASLPKPKALPTRVICGKAFAGL